jgi:hypothetical protein
MSFGKRVLRNLVSENSIIFIAIADLFVVGINSLVVVPFLIKLLPKEILNEFSLFLTLCSVFIVIFQFGLISSFSRFYFSEEELRVSETDVIKLQLGVAGIVIIPAIFFNSFLSIDSQVYISAIISSIASFWVSIRIVKLRIQNRIYQHYFLQLSFIFSYILILVFASLFNKINLTILLLSNILCGVIFGIVIITKNTDLFTKIQIPKLFIYESFSLYILNVCHVIIIRALPLFIQEKVLDKTEFSQINFALIYSGISFILVASFNKFSLNKFFGSKSVNSDNDVKTYFIIFHIITAIFFSIIIGFYFSIFFPLYFTNIFKYFILFFLSNFIWNLSLIETMNLQRDYKNYILKYIYIVMLILFSCGLFLIYNRPFYIKYIFILQLILSIFYFVSTYFFGKANNETKVNVILTFCTFIMSILIFTYYVKLI